MFYSKSDTPDEKQFLEVLGKSATIWIELKKYLSDQFDKIHEEWKFYSIKSGWTLKVISGKRTLFYVRPFENYFSLSFIFGEKAVAAVLQHKQIPESIKTSLKNATKYIEGTGVSVAVKTANDLKIAKILLAVKSAN